MKVHAYTKRYVGKASMIITSAKIGPPNMTTAEMNELPPIKAQWDTGATGTVISKSVAERIGLRPSGMKSSVKGYGRERQEVDKYVVTILLPNGTQLENWQVVCGEIDGADLIIGMDVICLGSMAITFARGETTFSYEIPSTTIVNYENEPELVRFPFPENLLDYGE